MNLLNDVANSVVPIGRLKSLDEILRDDIQLSGRVADKKFVQRSRMQREAFDIDVPILSRLSLGDFFVAVGSIATS